MYWALETDTPVTTCSRRVLAGSSTLILVTSLATTKLNLGLNAIESLLSIQTSLTTSSRSSPVSRWRSCLVKESNVPIHLTQLLWYKLQTAFPCKRVALTQKLLLFSAHRLCNCLYLKPRIINWCGKTKLRMMRKSMRTNSRAKQSKHF